MIAPIAQGLRLNLDECDHLHRLAHHRPPARGEASGRISPGMLRILDRLDDTPVEPEPGETSGRTRLGIALFGDALLRQGHERSLGYRWSSDPAAARRLWRMSEDLVRDRIAD